MLSPKKLTRDAGGTAIQGFTPNPDKCAAPVTIAAGATHTVSVGTEQLLCLLFQVSGDVDVYLNGDTTKIMTYGAWQLHPLILNHMITSVNFVNAGTATVTLQRWGM